MKETTLAIFTDAFPTQMGRKISSTFQIRLSSSYDIANMVGKSVPIWNFDHKLKSKARFDTEPFNKHNQIGEENA